MATRRSQATASCVPRPRAAPSTAATCGRGSSRSVDEHLPQAVGEPGVLDAGQVGAGTEVPARTGQHHHPGGVGPGVGVEQLVEGLVVEGVAALHSIDGEERDRSAIVQVDHEATVVRPRLGPYAPEGPFPASEQQGGRPPMPSPSLVGAAVALCLLSGVAACGGKEESKADVIADASKALQDGDSELNGARSPRTPPTASRRSSSTSWASTR